MHCAIYDANPAAKPRLIPYEMWDAYVEDRDMTRGTRTRKLTKEGQPLFYLLDASGNLVFFGPTMMFRLPYQRSVRALIPEKLRNPLLVDYADALFGFVREPGDFPDTKALPKQGQKSRAYASRVFITDATLTTQLAPQDLWLTETHAHSITPPILATPKPTSFQHYLVQPDTSGYLRHYDSPQEDAQGQLRGQETVIRGHKLYWHQGNKTATDLSAKYTDGDRMSRSQFIQDANGQWQVKDNSTQHTLFKPVKAGVQFTFRLYFDNLSEAELGALCWILHPLGEAHKEYCHSLGMGKPFGMGAVHLDATLYLTKRTIRYTTLFNGDRWETGTVSTGDRLSARTEQVTRLAETFEEDILNKLKPLNKQCNHLAELKRIGMLLKLMEWSMPVPQPETEYMTPNQFKARPVLPDPSYYAQEIAALRIPLEEALENDQHMQTAPSSTNRFAGLEQVLNVGRTADTPRVSPTASRRPRKKRERIVLVTSVKNGRARAKVEGGEDEFVCTNIAGYFKFKVGDRCQAEVTYNGETPVSAVFKGQSN
jgi:CRISPR-associated protein (TIGR03986 family)